MIFGAWTNELGRAKYTTQKARSGQRPGSNTYPNFMAQQPISLVDKIKFTQWYRRGCTWSSRPDVACIGPGHVLPLKSFALLCSALLCMGGSLRLTYTQLLHWKKEKPLILPNSRHSLPNEIAARQASYTISLFSISEERFPETIYLLSPCLRRWDVISQTVLLLLLLLLLLIGR